MAAQPVYDAIATVAKADLQESVFLVFRDGYDTDGVERFNRIGDLVGQLRMLAAKSQWDYADLPRHLRRGYSIRPIEQLGIEVLNDAVQLATTLNRVADLVYCTTETGRAGAVRAVVVAMVLVEQIMGSNGTPSTETQNLFVRAATGIDAADVRSVNPKDLPKRSPLRRLAKGATTYGEFVERVVDEISEILYPTPPKRNRLFPFTRRRVLR